MKNPMRQVNRRSGSVIIMTAFGIVFLVSMIALVTDVGWLYFQKVRIQTAVNASWKAGFDYAAVIRKANNGDPLSNEQKTMVEDRIKSVFKSNGYTETETSNLSISITQVPNATNSCAIYVGSSMPAGLFFANVMNFSSAKVSAERGNNMIASDTPDDGGGDGMVPLGVLHGDLLHGVVGEGKDAVDGLYYHPFTATEGYRPGVEYLLRIGKDSPYGNFHVPIPDGSTFLQGGGNSNEGSLRMGGNGKAYWGDMFENGYPGEVALNSRWNTEPGVAVGPVTDARDYRIDNNKRMVIVPIIDVPPANGGDPCFYNQGGTDQIRVIGFAQFLLTAPNEADYRLDLGPYSASDVEIRGTFVKYIVDPRDVPPGIITDP